jgi:hypothetical protein
MGAVGHAPVRGTVSVVVVVMWMNSQHQSSHRNKFQRHPVFNQNKTASWAVLRDENPVGQDYFLASGFFSSFFASALAGAAGAAFLSSFLASALGASFFASSFLAGACAKAKEAANMLATTSANDFIVISNWNENLLPDLPATLYLMLLCWWM